MGVDGGVTPALLLGEAVLEGDAEGVLVGVLAELGVLGTVATAEGVDSLAEGVLWLSALADAADDPAGPITTAFCLLTRALASGSLPPSQVACATESTVMATRSCRRACLVNIFVSVLSGFANAMAVMSFLVGVS